MADARHEDKISHGVERTSVKTADQTKRMAETAAQTNEQLARVGSDLLQHQAEMFQNALKFSVDMTSALMGRSTDQLSRAFGMSGEGVEKATEQSSRNTVTVLQSTAAAAKELSGISREYFEFLRQQHEGTMKRMNDLWGCRTPHDLAAVHSEIMRETMETAVQSSRKMADISVKAAENAAKHITQNANRRAA